MSELDTIHPADLARLPGFSAVSETAALRRPLADVVHATLQSAGRSAHTQRAYQTAIGLFVQHLDQTRGDLIPPDLAAQWRPLASADKQVERRGDRVAQRTVWTFNGPAAVLRMVDAGLLDGFRAWREAEGDSPNAASLRVYAVRTFLSVAYRDGILTTEQAQALGLKAYRQRQKRDEQPVGRRLTPAEVRTLRGACNVRAVKGKRDAALLDAMLYLGLRAEEVAQLHLSDFRQDGGRWWVVLSGKGCKTRRLKVHDKFFKSLTAWLNAAGLTLGESDGCVFLSVNKGDHITGNGLNANVIGRLVSEYGYVAGLAPAMGHNRLSPHDLRRTCARNAYDNGASLLHVQAMLGHSDPKTTARYIGAFDGDGETAVDYVRY